MGHTILRALIIVLVSAAAGVAINHASPRRLPLITPPKTAPEAGEIITLEEAVKLWRSGAVYFLDARSASDYAAGHIAQAISLPVEDFDNRYPDVARALTTNSMIVAYCDGQDCDLSHDLANQMRRLGYGNVRILINGWTSWRTARQPTNRGANP